jgi:hypothetical protein
LGLRNSDQAKYKLAYGGLAFFLIWQLFHPPKVHGTTGETTK